MGRVQSFRYILKHVTFSVSSSLQQFISAEVVGQHCVKTHDGQYLRANNQGWIVDVANHCEYWIIEQRVGKVRIYLHLFSASFFARVP